MLLEEKKFMPQQFILRTLLFNSLFDDLSDDGYYTINVGTPEAKGEWKIQAASISPMHGIQMAVPQNVVRIKPFQAMLFGIPKVNKITF